MENKANEAKPNTLLRKARTDKGWTQEQVAYKIGTNAKEVSRWELGQNVPSPYFKEKLSEVFAMTPEELGLIRSAQTSNVPNQESIEEPVPTEKSLDDSNNKPLAPTEASEALPSRETHTTHPQTFSTESYSQLSTVNQRTGLRGRRTKLISIVVVSIIIVFVTGGVIGWIALPNLFHSQQTPPTFKATPFASPTLAPTANSTVSTPSNSIDFSGTPHSAQWTINGNTVVSDGSAPSFKQSDIVLISPYRPSTNNYEVVVQIQEIGINPNQPQGAHFYGILIRGTKVGPIGYKGYFVEIVGSTDRAETGTVLAVTPPNFKRITSGPVDSLGAASHTYRVKVQGSRITLTIDNTTWLDVTDPKHTFLSGTTVGLVDSGCILQVRNFTVS